MSEPVGQVSFRYLARMLEGTRRWLTRYKVLVTILPSVLTDTQDAPDGPAKPAEKKGLRYFEVCLVLLVALSSALTSSIYLLIHGPAASPQNTSWRYLTGTLHELIALALLAYVLLRRGRRFRDLGLQWSLRDCGVGVILCIAGIVCSWVGVMSLQIFHGIAYGGVLRGHSGRDFWAHPGINGIPYLILTPFFEEMIVRAYLMTEILELTGSSVLALGISVLLQVSYHLYYGWFGALMLAFVFLVFALYYVRYRRALPVIVAHELYDLIAFMRLW
jgi:membrane protease YdiL (CAAX protease family)